MQTTLILAAGLVAGRLCHSGGAALQSLIYRSTLLAAVVCPLFAYGLAAAGFDRLLLDVEPYLQPEPIDSQIAANSPAKSAAITSSPIDLPGSPQVADVVGAAADSDEVEVTSTPPIQHPEQTSSQRYNSSQPAAPPSGDGPEPAQPARAGAAVIRALLTGMAWLAASLYLLIRLGVAHLRTIRLRRLAIPADAAEVALCRQLAAEFRIRSPKVLRAPFLSAACLVGYWRPAVLLPDADDTPLRQALLHELAHLSRRDCLWNLLRQLATAILPIQPLVWLLARRIEQTAEEVCDDFVVQHGADRCHYAEHLVELASRNLAPTLPAGVGMISFRSLSARRIARILDTSRTLSTRVGGRTIVATLLIAVAGTLLTASLGIGAGEAEAVDEPKESDSSVANNGSESPKATDGENNEKRTLSGQVLDADGKPVAGATVTAARLRSKGIGPYGWDKEREELARVRSDADGRFSILFTPLDPDDPQGFDSGERWRRLLVGWDRPCTLKWSGHRNFTAVPGIVNSAPWVFPRSRFSFGLNKSLAHH